MSMLSKGLPRKGDWIQVYTGIRFYPLDPRPEEIDIRDIAHALSMQCRFTGHTRRFYSVAEHSVLVSYLCDEKDALWGLLHDAAEAYLVDLARPIKKHSRLGDEYERIEGMIMEEVACRFGLPPNQPESVARADKRMLAVEARDLMAPLQPGWEKWMDLLTGQEPALHCWNPTKAEYMFDLRFKALTGDREKCPPRDREKPPTLPEVCA